MQVSSLRERKLAAVRHVLPSALQGSPARALIGLTVLAAALRFPTLGVQSYWYDEAVTVERVLRAGLGDTLSAVASSESTPPLYYVLAWGWSKLFGTGEVGLRSLSAVIGTATIPVVYAAAAETISRRAGLIAAAIAAVSPWLVWYSQEARSYALLMLLGGVSFLFFARALHQPSTRTFVWWALSSALALATHYFAALLVVPEAIWLLASVREPEKRATLLAVAGVVATMAALAPLALHQLNLGFTDWIGGYSLSWRLAEIPKQFIAGDKGVPRSLMLLPFAGLLALAGWLLIRAEGERRQVLVPVVIGAVVIAVPIGLIAVGKDYVLPRNLAVAWIPFVIVVAAGLGARRAGRLGLAVAVALCGLMAMMTLAGAIYPSLQRGDWRQAADLVGRAETERAIVLPFTGGEPLKYYAENARQLNGTIRVREIVLLGWTLPAPSFRPPPGFLRRSTERRGVYFSVRLTAARPHSISRGALLSIKLDPERAGVLAQSRSAAG